MFTELYRFASTARHHPVVQAEPLATVGRLAWWQLRRRLTSRPMTARGIGGGKFLVFPDRTSTTSSWYFRLTDFDEMLFLLHLLGPGDRFVDGGANLGMWSLLAAATGASVLAIEPSSDTFALLEQQVAVSPHRDRIRTVRCALAAAAGTVRLSIGLDAGNSVIADGDGVEVPARTLDELIADDVPTAIKLDLEGYELEALRGAGRVLTDPKLSALVIETFRPQNWRTSQLQDIETCLADAGFWPFAYLPASRVIRPLGGLDAPPTDSGQNTIYIRNPDAVQSRVRAAAGVRVGRRTW